MSHTTDCHGGRYDHTHPSSHSGCNADVPSTTDLMLVSSKREPMCVFAPDRHYRITYEPDDIVSFEHVHALLRAEDEICRSVIDITEWLRIVRAAGFTIQITDR